MKKYIEKQNYHIGSYYISFQQGEKGKEEDYKIIWNENQQFKDIDLFNNLYSSIICYKCAFNFIRHFICNQFVTLEQECIKTNIQNVKEVIEWVNSTFLPNDLKLYLASMIFRCDIDNINYECPRLNGCVRHFIQILMLLGYKFNLSQWQMQKLNDYFITQNKIMPFIPQLISEIGYPNSYGIDTKDFKSMYQSIQPTLQQILLNN